MQALSKALTEDELVYLRAQFVLLKPNGDGSVSYDNFKLVNTPSTPLNLISELINDLKQGIAFPPA